MSILFQTTSKKNDALVGNSGLACKKNKQKKNKSLGPTKFVQPNFFSFYTHAVQKNLDIRVVGLHYLHEASYVQSLSSQRASASLKF